MMAVMTTKLPVRKAAAHPQIFSLSEIINLRNTGASRNTKGDDHAGNHAGCRLKCPSQRNYSISTNHNERGKNDSIKR
jgi:hypothetical protein